MQKAFFFKYLPLILLGVLLLTGLVTIFVQVDNYGITIDEPKHDAYGHAIMEWYATFGKDTSFLTAFPTDAYLPEHGGFFDVVIAVAQQMFPTSEHWQVRHIVTALCGLLGLVVIALCAYELGMGSYWMAFLAAFALWFYPRYYGAIYNNPKDVPAAVTTMLVVWAILVLIKQWESKKHVLRNSLLVGFCIGLAVAIRVPEVIWYPTLVLILFVWWVLQGRRIQQEGKLRSELIQQVIAIGVISITSLLTMIAFWPYIFLNPVKNLLHSIKLMSQYPWDGPVFFNGITVPAEHLPRIYAPEWLVIGSPLSLVLFALLGLVIACLWILKKRAIEPRVGVVILSLFVPLGAIVVLHSVLYDSLRQILFIVPSMILLAVYGFVQSIQYMKKSKWQTLRWAAVGVATLTLVSYALVIGEMVRMSPFEYTYFSPIVGGLSGAQGKFETDYWGTCATQAQEWLDQNYQQYTNISDPSVKIMTYQYPSDPTLLPAFHADDTNPDFYIASTRYNLNQNFPGYKVIHVVAAEGVPMCVVKVKPAS